MHGAYEQKVRSSKGLGLYIFPEQIATAMKWRSLEHLDSKQLYSKIW